MDKAHIYEVKTYNGEKEFKVSKTYWRQAQFEIFGLEQALGREVKLDIVAYPLEDENYTNYFTPIDKNRIKLLPIEKDEEFINELLIPKTKILHECLERGLFPER